MRTGVIARRRSAVLAAVLALFVVALSGPAAATHRGTSEQGASVAAAVSHAAVLSRTAPERLLTAHRSGDQRNAVGGLPAAVVVVFLLALRVRRHRVNGSRPGLLPLVATGRGPPITS